MKDEQLMALANSRLEHAEECLTAAKALLENGIYKSAANRAYYALFHAMRAVLALDYVDMKHHSGIIAEFRRRYIKTGIFDAEFSLTISLLSDTRNDSDYDDYFVVLEDEVIERIKDAEIFLEAVKKFLLKQ